MLCKARKVLNGLETVLIEPRRKFRCLVRLGPPLMIVTLLTILERLPRHPAAERMMTLKFNLSGCRTYGSVKAPLVM